MMQLSFFAADPAPARVYGILAPKDRPRVQARATSIRARVMAWFREHPAAKPTAPQLGQALGLRVENCLHPRLSELVSDGWLVRTSDLAAGAHGCSVHRYGIGPTFTPQESM